MNAPQRLVRLEGTPLRLALRDEHRHLLRACFLERDAAIDAWQAWRRLVPLDDADGDSTRLLPLLHANLARHGVEDGAMAKYKGLLKYQWTENQRRLAGLRAAAEALRRTEWIAVRGLAMMPFEPVPGAFALGLQEIRPLSARAADEALKAAGWIEKSAGPWRRAMQHPAHGEIRLHATVLWNGSDSGDASHRTIDGIACIVPEAHDLAVLVAALGFHQPEFPRLNWIAELRVLLGRPEFAAWSAMLAAARGRRMLELVRAAVAFCEAELGLAVPGEARREMERIRPTYEELRTSAGPGAGIGLRLAARIERAMRG